MKADAAALAPQQLEAKMRRSFKSIHVVGGISFLIAKSYERMMSMRKLLLLTIALLAIALSAPLAASANSAGQCNVTRGNTVTSLSEWQSVLSSEGVTSQTNTTVFTKAGFVKHRIRVRAIGLDSCGNPIYGWTYVDVWVWQENKAEASPKPKAPTPPPCLTQTGPNTNSGNACQQQQSTETAKVTNDCKGPNWMSTQCVTTIIQITNQFEVVCGKIVYANGNVVYENNDGNVVNESYCSTTTTTVTPPPSCTSCTPPPCTSCTPPPPKANAQCTGLTVTNDAQVNLGVIAKVTYTASNATLKSIVYDWGDSHTTTSTNTTEKHVYASGNTYQVSAKLTFSTANGDITSNCNAQSVTPKNPSVGPGTGGGGGTGSGGSPGNPTSGGTCVDDSGHLVYGPADQFSNCPPGYVGTPVTASKAPTASNAADTHEFSLHA
jgi:uncharacterized protein YaiE (UPF0345 family)